MPPTDSQDVATKKAHSIHIIALILGVIILCIGIFVAVSNNDSPLNPLAFLANTSGAGMHTMMISGGERYIPMHSDPFIPNFSHPDMVPNRLVVSEKDGDWLDRSTWSSGEIPRSTDTVVIKHQVILTGDAESYDTVIHPGGTLKFAHNVNTKLEVGTLQVLPRGSLIIGTKEDPIQNSVTAEIVYTDRSINLERDPGQYGIGLLAHGNVSVYGAPIDETFIRLDREPLQGDRTLSLETIPTAWSTGDTLLLPNSTAGRASVKQSSGNEILTIKSITDTEITLQEPLSFDHEASRNMKGETEYYPHVGNLTRNVVFQSENPQGTRGHTLIAMRSNTDIRYAEFKNLGRTINGITIDETVFDDAGKPLFIAENHIARYPLHTHHLVGPETPQANGFQYTLLGNVIHGGLEGKNLGHRWGIVNHGSHFGLMEDNIVYNVAGAGIITEDGSESYNVYDHNLVVVVTGAKVDVSKSAQFGDGFWMRSMNNYMRNNVVVDNTSNGFTLFNQIGSSPRTVTLATTRGVMPSMSGRTVHRSQVPILEFSNNEVYGPTGRAINLWSLGTLGVDESVIKDFVSWNLPSNVIASIFGYGVNNLTIDGFVARGNLRPVDPSKQLKYQVPRGPAIAFSRTAAGTKILNADIQGHIVGFDMPSMPNFPDASDALVVENSYIAAHKGIVTSLPARTRPNNSDDGRYTVIKNVVFDPLPYLTKTDDEPQTIVMSYKEGGAANRGHIINERFYVIDYDGAKGENFQVFYKEQHPDFPMPEIEGRENGLTNQQAWDTYGIAIAGSVARCLDEDSYPEIGGYTCSIENLDTTVPTRPTNVQVSAITDSTATLSWQRATDDSGVGGYRIYQNNQFIAVSPTNSYTAVNLNSGTSYQFHVAAIDTAGNISPAEAVWFTTTGVPSQTSSGSSGSSPSTPVVTAPPPPPLNSGDTITLIDFGRSNPENSFGLSGWDTWLHDRYTYNHDIGPGGSTIDRGGNKAFNYQGVSGKAEEFNVGDQIVVTWYNNTDTSITIAPRVSFNDSDRPGSSGDSGEWYQMSLTEIDSKETGISIYTFDERTEGFHSLVNVSSNFGGSKTLIADKIQLVRTVRTETESNQGDNDESTPPPSSEPPIVIPLPEDAPENEDPDPGMEVDTPGNDPTEDTPPIQTGKKILLIDFGRSNGDNSFGLDGWDNWIHDRYTYNHNIGPGGSTIDRGSNKAYNFQGVTGSTYQFNSGDQIVVTWYNNSTESVNFTPKISLDDPDRITRSSATGTWYSMSNVALSPGGTMTSTFTFDSSSAGNYSLVNLNSNISNTREIIADKIELVQ